MSQDESRRGGRREGREEEGSQPVRQKMSKEEKHECVENWPGCCFTLAPCCLLGVRLQGWLKVTMVVTTTPQPQLCPDTIALTPPDRSAPGFGFGDGWIPPKLGCVSSLLQGWFSSPLRAPRSMSSCWLGAGSCGASLHGTSGHEFCSAVEHGSPPEREFAQEGSG